MLIESVKAGFRNLTVFIKAGQSGLGMRIHSVIKTMIQQWSWGTGHPWSQSFCMEVYSFEATTDATRGPQGAGMAPPYCHQQIFETLRAAVSPFVPLKKTDNSQAGFVRVMSTSVALKYSANSTWDPSPSICSATSTDRQYTCIARRHSKHRAQKYGPSQIT